MAVTSRGISVNIGVFHLLNNIRRAAGVFSKTFVTTTSTRIETTSVPAGGTFSFVPTSAVAFVMMDVSAPVLADVVYAAAVVNGVPRPGNSVTTVVNSVFMSDDLVSSITVRNPQAAPVTINVIQG